MKGRGRRVREVSGRAPHPTADGAVGRDGPRASGTARGTRADSGEVVSGEVVSCLCGTFGLRDHATVDGARYHFCPRCALVWIDRGFLPRREEERARYDTHRNDPSDPGYRRFLDTLAIPLAGRLPPGAEGLDYGSGPGPTLSVMLSERGFPTEIYDPFYAARPAVLSRTYDFVTCSETAEHFHDPGAEFARLDRLLRPGGWLGLMTGVRTPEVRFESWWYVRDPTHVCFYAPETLRWIAHRHGWRLERPSTNVALFAKPDSGRP